MANPDEVVRRIQATLEQAAADGLLSHPEDTSTSVIAGWVLLIDHESTGTRWLDRFSKTGMWPWQWRGMLHETIDRT